MEISFRHCRRKNSFISLVKKRSTILDQAKRKSHKAFGNGSHDILVENTAIEWKVEVYRVPSGNKQYLAFMGLGHKF